jgi:hypothetical protein
MAELKRSFLGAKMDKDSDPKLIKPGNYRDARNVHVVPTEGGTMGNAHLWLGTQGVIATSNLTEIGLFEDKANDIIYLFLTDGTENKIIAYNVKTNTSEPILVDLNSELSWSTTDKITGIQMIEDTLGWVLDNNEPCSFKPQEFKAGTVDLNTHTQYEGRDFILSDITMMRISPQTAPTVVTSRSVRDGVISGVQNRNFTVVQNNDGSISASLPTDSLVQLTFVGGTNFQIGDRLRLSTPALSTDEIEDEYVLVLVVESTQTGGTIVNTKILSATSEIEDNELQWEVKLLEGNPLYELSFPRFAYRWKYKNDQYSTISPFTQVVFDPEKFEYNTKKGFNVGMTNNIRKITLSGLTGNADFPIPDDVDKIDILYKDGRSNTLYVADSIEATEDEFVITNELLSKVVQSNQLLRTSDATPKSAIALESVANVFVLGNYKQGYNTNELVEFQKASVISKLVEDIGVPEKSIKSDRKLQGGVTFLDALGRETPVFTDESGVIEITKEDSSTANKITFQMGGIAPSWAHSFKYYLKDPANEYYNLAADRMYITDDGSGAWISFPSSERNKIDLETYLIAKKYHDRDIPIYNDNKYKILDIQSQAPEEIKSAFQKVQASSVYFDANFAAGIEQDTKKAGATPTPNSNSFLIAGNASSASNGVTSPFKKALEAGSFIRFEDGSSFSNFYRIEQVISNKSDDYWVDSGASDEHLQVFIEDAFGEDVNFLYEDVANAASPLTNEKTTIVVYKREELSNQGQFQGRFFVKLSINSLLTDMFNNGGDYIVNTAATVYPGSYPNGSTNFKIHAGGRYPKRGYSFSHTVGGLDVARNPSYANDDVNDTIFDIVFEKRHKSPTPNKLIEKIQQIGTKIRFTGGTAGHEQIYTVTQSIAQFVDYQDRDYTRYWTVLDPPLKQSVSPYVTGSNVTVEVLELADEKAFTSDNPAIFETEPKEAIDLDIFYEASDAFLISEFNEEKELDYYNCFSFGNGVESNRIRDDFNAPYIDKGPKGSTTDDDPYAEEHLPNGLIFSGIYNSTSGVNNLNQFILAEPILKQISPLYGSIQKLHARNTDLIVFCEDKVLKVLANKDALYNADGQTNLTATNKILGQAVPFSGEYGISTDPASFATYGTNIYFADRKRGEMLRLSNNGIVSITGTVSSDIESNLAAANNISGSYDAASRYYILSFDNISYCFTEEAKGVTTIWEEAPKFGLTVNDVYYTTDNGGLYAHNDADNRNNFYGSIREASIQVAFNDAPGAIKSFFTAAYEGDSGWYVNSFNTNLQNGGVLPFVKKEGKFYNYVKGRALLWNELTQSGDLNPDQFNIQGIGLVTGITGDTEASEFTLTVKDDPSDH